MLMIIFMNSMVIMMLIMIMNMIMICGPYFCLAIC